ncbi:hypothetical protein MKK65_11950 [Methylobacterium sp. J-001]|uniref:hypothetical protein n=1 Tax=Methylobacterium sp. J-001 TaxID=2836609 RepID=UPI001FB9DB56|nr:hypothetical protein [Methylobacterium sp. J-001]MCJ2117264.1 hypothetical protein [Methylobacterium sp. J-001]
MSEPSDRPDRAAVHRAMARLDGLARGLGPDEATTRQIVEAVVADMPDQPEEGRFTEARRRMIVASA